ncbi:MAG: homoserine O-acetyltransferase [Firmicutes bacterium]|nr:homoserine O-acetyltransferase [Bacillota bacterium]
MAEEWPEVARVFNVGVSGGLPDEIGEEAVPAIQPLPRPQQPAKIVHFPLERRDVPHEAGRLRVIPEGRFFQLDSGQRLTAVDVAYETYGRLDPDGSNAIIVFHALTGSQHVAGRDGWWRGVVGPGRALDTRRYYVVCVNILGGCYGTTGPLSLNPATGRPFGSDFPPITLRDAVRLQRLLLDQLGVRHVVAAVGGSMGGMEALEWTVLYPAFTSAVVSIAAPARANALSIALNQIGRDAIREDPDFADGHYYPGLGPKRGLQLARELAMVSYRSPAELQKRFGQRLQGETSDRFRAPFEVGRYLRHQGQKLAERFDANSYLYLTEALDRFDLGAGRGGVARVLADLETPLLVVGIDSDWLYPADEQRDIVEKVRSGGGRAAYAELHSLFGHDGFLIEQGQVGYVIDRFLREVPVV